jgi:RHS repeat-associated protein
VYDGVNPVQEKAGATVTANLLTGLGIDEFFTRTDSVGVRSLLPDVLGSTVALGDGTGTLQTQYTYEPFGATSATGVISGNAFKYTGREDDGSGLMYYRARYYQPRLQRFIAEDPYDYDGGDSNLYMYVANNPTRYSDPHGLYIVLPGVPVPSSIIDALLKCIEAKTGGPLIVTSTSRISKQHPAGTPHARGVAVDIRYPADPNKVLCAAASCGAGFALDEKKHPSANSDGPHIHIQIPPGKRGGSGDLPKANCGGCGP